MMTRACERCDRPGPGSEKAGRRIANRIESLFVTIYVLELVGATAVTSLGWAACQILKIDWIPFGPLWFAGYLFVYNLDRLYPDPADPMNVPVRSRKTAELRSARISLIMLASLVLIAWPLLVGPWWLVLAMAFGVALLQFYSRPIPGVGHRFKDLPYLKSLFVPGIIAGVLVVWPCLENARSFRFKECFVFLLCLLVLTINSLVFDYRDVAGDAALGTGTLPVRMGRKNTICLLLVLVLALIGVSWSLGVSGLVSQATPAVLAGGGAGLLLSLFSRFRPMTISVLADLFLMLPAVLQFLAGISACPVPH